MRLVALAMLVASAPAAASASDILMAVMQDASGQMSMHQQVTSAEDCAAFLETFRAQRAEGGKTELTLRDPDFTGTVIEPLCVHEDGTATGPDGPVALPK